MLELILTTDVVGVLDYQNQVPHVLLNFICVLSFTTVWNRQIWAPDGQVYFFRNRYFDLTSLRFAARYGYGIILSLLW